MTGPTKLSLATALLVPDACQRHERLSEDLQSACQKVDEVEGRGKVPAHLSNSDSSTKWQGSENSIRPIDEVSGRKELDGGAVCLPILFHYE